ncbi:proton-conducting transporter transmembrane domain-containing protein [Flavihumibacter profundi]|uniref:proton-conducting transporter transmembrane domain-containing protein n=1 Tax=Flavihumibacter profundi TaxID=2716883 RepID=UPI001CC544D3|nr:proton-conducting transporter membrane subunit [Flavihumibacter profundi]MBZ5857093.1 hypothetical protein [Flavihumibacter profundi]
MEAFELTIGSLTLVLLSLIAIPLLPIKHKATGGLILVVLIAILSTIPASKALFQNSTYQFRYETGYSPGNISIRIDSLSAWFILIINIICISGALYGKGYLKAYLDQKANISIHWILFVVLQMAMLWVCMAQQGLVFLIAWEIMSLSALLLLMFEHEKIETLNAGIRYLVQTHLGVILLTTGFIWLYSAEGSFEFSAIDKFFRHHPNQWLFLLFFLGFGFKAGIVPLHTWLPYAHPAAPSHISGVMSGILVKMGIYGILRITTFLHTGFFQIGTGILLVAIITGLYGILNAAMHRDLKRMLAYCTIENIGIIFLGMGIGLIGKATGNLVLASIGFATALLHTLNHALYKSLLFFTAGNIYQQTHTRDMEKLGGLIKNMPGSGLMFLIGSIAIAGLPPFNGFVSEFLLYTGIFIGIKSIGVHYVTIMITSFASLALIGGISMLTFTKSFGTIFLGNPRTEFHRQPREVSLAMLLPCFLIICIMLSIGLLPQFYFSLVQNVVQLFVPVVSTEINFIPAALTYSLAAIGKYALLFILLSITILIIRKIISRENTKPAVTTWACGYPAPTPKMEYTGKSFSKSLGKLLNFIVPEGKKYKEIQTGEIFPKKRKYASHYMDVIETKIFNSIIDRMLYSLNYFKFIQNGKIQAYILYGIFFIVLVFIGTIFKLI